MDEEVLVFGFIISIIIGIVLLFVFRNFLCWYWKIDRMVESLEIIDMNTRYNPKFQLDRMVELLEIIDKKLDDSN